MQFHHTGSRRGRTDDHCGPHEKYFYSIEAKALNMIGETTIPSARPLPLMEAFYTIQGEGYHQGKAAYFIRLGGCDVGCTWCDVKESWDASAHPLTSADTIVENALKYPSKA